MSRYFYEGLLNEKNSVVIYEYNINGAIYVGDFILIDGYLNGARIIIDEIKIHTKTTTQHDHLLYPLLNIYCVILESILKTCIRHMCEHKNQFNCKFLNSFDEEKLNIILNKHEIQDLCEFFKEITKNQQKSPHKFKEFEFILSIIREFEKNYINFESSRYHYSKSVKNKKFIPPIIYQRYNTQKNVNILQLHEDIEYAVQVIKNYLENENFSLCSLGCFDIKGIKRLEEIYILAIKNKKLFNSLSIEDDTNCSIEEIIQKMFDNKPLLDKFYNKVQKLPCSEQEALVITLYLATRPLECIGLNINFPKEILIKKIYEVKHLFKKGIDNLKEYILNSKKFIIKK